MKLAVILALAGGAAIGALANAVSLATGLAVALVILGIAVPVVIAIRADQRRNGIASRFAERKTPGTAPAR